MKVIVGLGNPGTPYARTRHNLGFRVIDALARLAGTAVRRRTAHSRVGEGMLAGTRILLAKPQTYMNEAGVALRALLRLTPHPVLSSPDDLIVIHDDLDLPLGRVRIKTRGSDGGHRGIRSIIHALGTDRFIRVKIGIGKSPTMDPAEYVLAPFEAAELPAVEAGVERAVRVVQGILGGDVAAVTSRFNRSSPGRG